MLIGLGPEATVDSILEKLDNVYGQVDAEADVLAAFYTARQGPQEAVADWSCRLEAMFARVPNQATSEALRQMFWTGLRQELKDASAYHFDHIKSFDDLRKQIRRIEKQHPTAAAMKEKTASCKSAQDLAKEDKDSKLEAMIRQLSSKMDTEMKAIKQDITAFKEDFHGDRRDADGPRQANGNLRPQGSTRGNREVAQAEVKEVETNRARSSATDVGSAATSR